MPRTPLQDYHATAQQLRAILVETGGISQLALAKRLHRSGWSIGCILIHEQEAGRARFDDHKGEPGPALWRPTEKTAEVRDRPRSTVLALVVANPGCTIQWMHEQTGRETRTLRARLGELLERGLVRAEGRGRKGDPYHWFGVERGTEAAWSPPPPAPAKSKHARSSAPERTQQSDCGRTR